MVNLLNPLQHLLTYMARQVSFAADSGSQLRALEQSDWL